MTNWNYADVWETVADVRPDAIAVTQGDRHVNWADFDRGADGVAQFLLDQGVGPAGQGRGLPLQLPRISAGLLRRHQDRVGSRQHELPLRR